MFPFFRISNPRSSLFLTVAAAVGMSSAASASDQIPGAPQRKPIAIVGGTLHTVSGNEIAGGTILFQDGKIVSLGATVELPEGTVTVDAKGKHVYPGLIDSLTSLGLVEVESIRASVDTTETGNINPNVKAMVAFNPDSETIPVARANGVLSAITVPSGGIVSGQAALMQLDGWTWEDMCVKSDAGMVINWPRFGGGGAARGGRGGEAAAGEETSDRLAPLHQLMREVAAYKQAKEVGELENIDLRLEAMLPVVEGKLPVLAIANAHKQIQTAVAFSKQYGLKLIIVGGADAGLCTSLLSEEKIPVVISSVYRLPARHDASYDAIYGLPAKLEASGVKYCIGTDGRFGASMVRNLPYHAATAVAFGLSKDSALRSITLSTAEIFGTSDRMGSLDAGKDATLFIVNGDILEMASQVEKAYIQGREVDLTSKHTQLYEKYKTKYSR